MTIHTDPIVFLKLKSVNGVAYQLLGATIETGQNLQNKWYVSIFQCMPYAHNTWHNSRFPPCMHKAEQTKTICSKRKSNCANWSIYFLTSVWGFMHGQALLLDSDLAPLFQFKWTSWGLLLGTQITPLGVDFLDHNFLSSKNSG